MEIVHSIESLKDTYLKDKFLRAVTNVQRTIDLYGVNALAFSFNGGKDSTVVLHVLRAAIALRNERLTNGTTSPSPSGSGGILNFFFVRRDDFPEVLQFVHEMDAHYGLQLKLLHGDFKAGLEHLVNVSGIHAIFLGTRRGDPNAQGQDEFCPSSPGWPPFMRVNPVLGWTYADVWAFLRATRVPYCSLYDKGFTSLGSVDNTRPNSALRKEDGTYAPAHLLYDIRMERAGRSSAAAEESVTPPAIALTAALVIIGDELLSGKVDDVNTHFICRELHALGWQVSKVSIVPDQVAAISAELRALSKEHTVVITSGGVGPTIDDVTMQGVADALGHNLTRDQDLEHRLRMYFGSNVTQSHLKMAEAPSDEVTTVDFLMEDGRSSPFPVLRCRNIYVLPGVPHLLQRKWKAVKQHLSSATGHLEPFRSVTLRLSMDDETTVAPTLQRLSAKFEGSVGIGSYPIEGQQDGTGIILSLESKDPGQLEAARTALITELPPGAILGEQRDSSTLQDSIMKS